MRTPVDCLNTRLGLFSSLLKFYTERNIELHNSTAGHECQTGQRTPHMAAWSMVRVWNLPDASASSRSRHQQHSTSEKLTSLNIAVMLVMTMAPAPKDNGHKR
jgi:hypothetical protein